jgi:hypothetical protein
MPHGVEAGEVAELRPQGMHSGCLTAEAVDGIGRGQRANAGHGNLQGWAWQGEPCGATMSGRNG